jgi:hypothetical protein
MKSSRLILSLLFFAGYVPAAAQSQQPDMDAMLRWTSSDIVRYHIVGEFAGRANVIGDANWIGYADVTDRVTIDLTWKLSEAKLVGTPTWQNEKSAVANLRNYEPKCLPPVLGGDYEHFELLGIKDGPGGALELSVRTTYPPAQVHPFCTGKLQAVKGRVNTRPESLAMISPVMFAMPLPDSDNLRISKDKKSLIHKKDGWTWTFYPTPVVQK